MTHDELVTQCGVRFRDTANNVVDAATWSVYVNEAYKEGNRYSQLWPWLESSPTTVTVNAHSASAALPADTFQVHFVYDQTDGFELMPLQGRRMQGDFDLTTSATEAPPEAYRLAGSNIFVYPTPSVNTTLKVDYVTAPALLATSAEPVWPETWHSIIVEGAVALAYMDDGDDKQYQLRWTRFQEGLAKMLAAMLLMRQSDNVQIVDTWETGMWDA